MRKDELKVPLKVVSSIMNYGGYKSLLTYLSCQIYKKAVQDEYLDYFTISKLNLVKSESDWIKSMDKLCHMKLAVKNGSKYITRSKYTEWRKWSEKNTPRSMKFNGTITYDMAKLYNNRDCNLRDEIYLDLRNTVIGDRSISRKWLEDLTGINKSHQKAIEKRNGAYEQEHYIPVSESEFKDGKVGDIPVVRGHIDVKGMKCFRSKKGKENCSAIQLGHKVKVKSKGLSNLTVHKNQYKKVKGKNMINLNDDLRSTDVQNWNDCDVFIDNSSNGITKKTMGVLSVNDKRFKSWKDIKHYDYHNVSVIDDNGELSCIRSSINKLK